MPNPSGQTKGNGGSPTFWLPPSKRSHNYGPQPAPHGHMPLPQNTPPPTLPLPAVEEQLPPKRICWPNDTAFNRQIITTGKPFHRKGKGLGFNCQGEWLIVEEIRLGVFKSHATFARSKE